MLCRNTESHIWHNMYICTCTIYFTNVNTCTLCALVHVHCTCIHFYSGCIQILSKNLSQKSLYDLFAHFRLKYRPRPNAHAETESYVSYWDFVDEIHMKSSTFYNFKYQPTDTSVPVSLHVHVVL